MTRMAITEKLNMVTSARRASGKISRHAANVFAAV